MMTKISVYGIIGLGVLHLLVLGADAFPQFAGWAAGNLWTWEHWGPLVEQRSDLVVSGFAFWSTIGSFAVPLIILGSLMLWMMREGIAVPRFVGYGLLGWGLLGTLIMLPSGFPVFLLVAAAFCISLSRNGSAGSHRH